MTDDMTITPLPLPRKYRLPVGVQRRVARKLRLSEGMVSGIVNGTRPLPLTEKGRKTWARVERAVSREMAKLDEPSVAA